MKKMGKIRLKFKTYSTVFISVVLINIITSCNLIMHGRKIRPTITSNIPNSEVYVNGKYMGRTPCKLALKRNVKKGVYNVTVSNQNYNSLSQNYVGKFNFVNLAFVVPTLGIIIPFVLADFAIGTWRFYEPLEYKNTVQFDLMYNTQYIEEQKELAKEYKKQEEEQKWIQTENEKKAKIAENEYKYKQAVQNARNQAQSKSGWSVIEDSGGYYIGETKGGKKEGYGEYYWKNLEPIEDMREANISYKGGWANDEYNGQGEFKNYYKTIEDVFLWTSDYRHYCTTQANFINGIAEGDGYFSVQVSGFLAGSNTYDRVLYQNGRIVRNYSEEARKAKSDEIKYSACFKFIETNTVSYSDGGDQKATGYKFKCVPPSKYSLEYIIYYNPGGSRYSKGWYKDDGGLLFKDSRTGNKNETFEQAAKKTCGCY